MIDLEIQKYVQDEIKKNQQMIGGLHNRGTLVTENSGYKIHENNIIGLQRNRQKHIDIIAIHPDNTSGVWTREYRAVIMGGDIYSAAQNDYIDYYAYMQQGIWTFTLLHHTANNRGIYTITIDDIDNEVTGTRSIGTIDGYTAGVGDNTVSAITGIDIPFSGNKVIRLKMANKNAASAGYAGVISLITLLRTSNP